MVNYYDDYSFTDTNRPRNPINILGQTVTYETKGLLTGTWTKTLDDVTWSKTYHYYNEKGREIYVYGKNHLGGYTFTTSLLDFRGKILKSETTHTRLVTDPQIKIVDNFEYDHAERLKKHYQKIATQPEELIVKNTYDELGTLVQEDIGGANNASNALQNINYDYTIRGWLKQVNDVNNMGNDLFAYTLKYNETTEGTAYADNQYNGNIKQNIWRSAHDNTKKAYVYDYDDLNRFLGAFYRENNTLTGGAGKFETYYLNYDANGNIETLKRNAQAGQIDNLTYTYDTGNKLLKIADASSPSNGFFNGTNTGNDYDYDDNGNLTKDLNKNITLIEYNHLDLVKKVTFNNGNTIEFTYDASGNKLRMTTKENGVLNTIDDYLGAFQYGNYRFKLMHLPKGYVSENSGVYKYKYVLKDHLGNSRVSFSDTDGNGLVTPSEILSNTDYYPMGMIHHGEYVLNSNYNFKYQGKEKLAFTGYNMYDFGSRMYDASVGRWFNTDPQNQFSSPYLAMGNNWINGVDPDGEFFVPILMGAALGGMFNAVMTDLSGGDFRKGFLNGAIAGAIGGAAGAYASSLTSFSKLGIGFIRGAAEAAVQGAAGGFTSGIAGTFINNGNIGDALGNGFKGLLGGSVSGALVGGLQAGIRASNHQGNFWTGDGATFDVPDLQPNADSQVGEGMEYSNEYGEGYLDYFPEMEHPYEYHADGTAPPKYTYNNEQGVFYNEQGKPVLGVTRYIYKLNQSNIYMARKAFSSKELLYLTTGHELLHLAHFSAGLLERKPVTAHNSIYDWQYRQAKAWGLSSLARSYKARIIPGIFNKNYDWRKYCIGICPTKNFLN
jgi:RHS repeat-associated protein